MNLVELGQGIFALIAVEPRFGYGNVGLVIDDDGLTVIDTGTSPEMGHVAKSAINELTAHLELPIRRVTVSSSRVAFSGGSWAFWQSAFYGTTPISDQLDFPANLDALSRLLPEHSQHFHGDFETRPITHVIDEPAWLTPSCFALPLPGECASNLVIATPGVEATFVGALGSFGVTPLAYDGDLAAWVCSLDELSKMSGTIVPGHGPTGGTADLIDLRNYLEACIELDGDKSSFPAGPWDRWTDRRFDAVNIERAMRLKRGDSTTPDAMYQLLGIADA